MDFVSLTVINALKRPLPSNHRTTVQHYLMLTYESVPPNLDKVRNVPTNLGPCRDTIRVASERSTNERVWLSGRWFIAVISACSSSREGRPTLQGKPGARSRSRAEKLVPVSESGLTEFKIITVRLKSLSHALYLHPCLSHIYRHTFSSRSATRQRQKGDFVGMETRQKMNNLIQGVWDQVFGVWMSWRYFLIDKNYFFTVFFLIF